MIAGPGGPRKAKERADHHHRPVGALGGAPLARAAPPSAAAHEGGRLIPRAVGAKMKVQPPSTLLPVAPVSGSRAWYDPRADHSPSRVFARLESDRDRRGGVP